MQYLAFPQVNCMFCSYIRDKMQPRRALKVAPLQTPSPQNCSRTKVEQLKISVAGELNQPHFLLICQGTYKHKQILWLGAFLHVNYVNISWQGAMQPSLFQARALKLSKRTYCIYLCRSQNIQDKNCRPTFGELIS